MAWHLEGVPTQLDRHCNALFFLETKIESLAKHAEIFFSLLLLGEFASLLLMLCLQACNQLEGLLLNIILLLIRHRFHLYYYRN